MANSTTNARSRPWPWYGEASRANEAVPARETPMSTSGLGQWSVAQPSPTYSGTVTNNCRPHSQAAVCADAPWLAMMGMRGTVANPATTSFTSVGT